MAVNPVILSISFVIFGFIFEAWWLVAIGGAGLLLTAATHAKAQARAPAGGKTRYKLVQAPQDAWEDDDTLSYIYAMTGPRQFPMKPPEDPLRAVSRTAQGNIPRDITRNILPFSNYGRESVFEQLLIGLPVNIGTLIKKK